MAWTLCVWITILFPFLTRGHDTLREGYTLVPSGYHVCPGTEIFPMTSLIAVKNAYTETVPCGGWLPWKTCNVTRYSTVYRTRVIDSEKQVTTCCEGYEQVGSYCALALNRSAEFTAKPGVCPVRSVSGSGSGSGCRWDTDCPGLQKCCSVMFFNASLWSSTEQNKFCVEPETHVNMSSWLNVTLTVKSDFSLVNTSRGIFNHTRLLHSVVTGALRSPQISVYHTHSWSTGRFSTSSCLLLGSSQIMSFTNVSDTLLLLLENIEEVTTVDVRDVDECATPILSECSSLAHCSNTLSSYNCTCAPGSADLQPSRPGTQCMNTSSSSSSSPSSSSSSSSSSGFSDWNVISFGPLRKPPQKIIATTLFTPTSNTAISNTSFTLSSPAPPCSSNSSSLPGLSIPQITNLWAKNVTSSSFKLLWDVPSEISVTSSLTLFHGTQQMDAKVTSLSDWTWSNLQPGVLYTVKVALCMCGYCGNTTELKVKTDAQVLEAVSRITNINFTDVLLNPASQEFKTLSEKIRNETLHSIPSWIMDLVLSEKLIIIITRFSPGSVVVTFSLVFLPGSTLDIYSISRTLMESLQNSTWFTIDRNSTTISDVNECALGQADCSPWAECVNTFGSYTCACHHGYTDANPERPGRTCTANSETPFTSAPNTTVISTTFTVRNASADPITFSTSTSINSTSASRSTESSSPPEPSPNITTHLPSTPSSITSTHHSTQTTPLSSTSQSTTITNTTAPIIISTESITVECGAGFMIVSVLRNFLNLKHISVSSLYLGIPGCNVTEENQIHVKLLVAWGTCGTQLRNNSQNSTVQVNLYSADARLQVPVICTYINSFIISAGYSSSGFDTINNVVEGSGMYHVTVRLLNGTYPLPQNYTLSPDDEVIIEVGLSSNMTQIKVVINKCWANPSYDPTVLPHNIFLENSCPLLDRYTTVVQNGESTRSMLSVNLYRLVEFEVIYLHCQIQICIETPTATCRPECYTSRLARTSRGANVIGMAKASYGPLMKSNLVVQQDSAWNMRTIGFILLALGVCVLVLGAVAVLMFCRRRMGNYNFQFKAREENFTYHVFDT